MRVSVCPPHHSPSQKQFSVFFFFFFDEFNSRILSSSACFAFSARTLISLSSSTFCRLARDSVRCFLNPFSSSSSALYFLRQLSISTLVRFALVSRSTSASSSVAVSCFSA